MAELRGPVEHLTVAERTADGRAARTDVPRSVHATWEPAAGRPDPVALLEEQGATRVPELVPIRYGRMLVSPFTFYRGAAYLMASDLSDIPRTGLMVQLCGDAHLSNFGVFAAPDRRLVFSINDFDETLPGPFEWDVKRLVTSFEVAGRDRGFDTKQRRTANLAVLQAYREAMHDMAQMRTLDLWYARLDVDDIAAQLQRTAEPDSAEAVHAQRGQGQDQGQHQGVRQARPRRGRSAAGSSATHHSSSRSATCSLTRSPARSRRPCTTCSAPTGAPCQATIGTCWSASATSTRPARWSASEASAPAPGSC